MKRLFRGLRKREPRPRYDSVVIGGGIGGLVAANLLAKQGLAVLLVEQHYMIGGYCSTFKRRGYTFDAATHFYPLLGNPDTITGRVLTDLGVRTEWIKMDPVDTFHLPDGTRFEVPAEMDLYLERLKQQFPHEIEAIERFFEAVKSAYLHGMLNYFRGRATAQFKYFRDWTVRDALDRFFQDPKLKLVLTADCPHWGGRPDATSFVFDSMLRLSYFLGNYYPKGGSQAFADELARCFEDRGGEILMSSQVKRILVENGAATGVAIETTRGALQGRYRIAAGSIVSNADLRLTLEELLPEEAVPPELRAKVRELEPSFPCFLTHLGLRGVSRSHLERIQGYYWNHWDPDRVGVNGLRCKVFSPTVYEPAMAPEGGQIIILQKVLDLDFEAVTDWPAHKLEVERYVLDHLATLIPNLEDKVVTHLSASAKTSERFTFNSVGAMLGWRMSPQQLGLNRPGIESPIENLYFTGHWARPGGGITPVIISAVQTAEAIAKATDSLARLSHPSPKAVPYPPGPPPSNGDSASLPSSVLHARRKSPSISVLRTSSAPRDEFTEKKGLASSRNLGAQP